MHYVYIDRCETRKVIKMDQLKREQNFYSQLNKSLKKLKGFISDELTAVEVNDLKAEKLTKSISLLEDFCRANIESLDSALDDFNDD